MTRSHLASAALVALSLLGSTGCGVHYHRARYARYHYVYAGSVSVAPMVEAPPVAYEPPPPPPAPPPRPQPRIVHVTSPNLPPGTTVIIVNPTPAQARQAQQAQRPRVVPVAPPPQDEPEEEAPPPPQRAPQQAPQQADPSWFEGE